MSILFSLLLCGILSVGLLGARALRSPPGRTQQFGRPLRVSRRRRNDLRTAGLPSGGGAPLSSLPAAPAASGLRLASGLEALPGVVAWLQAQAISEARYEQVGALLNGGYKSVADLTPAPVIQPRSASQPGRGKFVKFLVASVFVLALLLLGLGTAGADVSYTGVISTDPTDLDLFNTLPTGTVTEGSNTSWGEVGIGWGITHRSTGADPWHYVYAIDANASGDTGNELTISHFILQVSPDFTSADMVNLSTNTSTTGPQTWTTADPSNPGIPSNFYGISFSGGLSVYQISFDSDRAPTWGNAFVTQDGDQYGYDTGWFDTSHLDATSGSNDDRILVPDAPSTPEPGSLALGLCALGAALVGVLRRRARR